MDEDKQPSVESELEVLRKRSGDLIAEVERISRRINELTELAKQSPPNPTDPAITDTWVEGSGLQTACTSDTRPLACGKAPEW